MSDNTDHNDPVGDFLAVHARVVERMRNEKNAWIERLSEAGAVAIHPDDGWVDRNKNFIIFCYPDLLKHRPVVGDKVVLGYPEKFRWVRIIRTEEAIWKLTDSDMTKYYFEEIKDADQ